MYSNELASLRAAEKVSEVSDTFLVEGRSEIPQACPADCSASRYKAAAAALRNRLGSNVGFGIGGSVNPESSVWPRRSIAKSCSQISSRHGVMRAFGFAGCVSVAFGEVVNALLVADRGGGQASVL